MPTRLYFPTTTAAPVSPSYTATWNSAGEAARRKLILAADRADGAYANGTQIGPWTANSATTYALDRQYVSDPLVAQTISGTIKGQLQVRELGSTDNVDELHCCIYVVSNDGGTVRGTLLARGFYGTRLEFPSTTTLANRFFANGDALSSVSASEGDRLVIELGYCTGTGTSTTPEALARWGAIAANSDLPEDQTSTATNLNPWVEFSGALTFLGSVTGTAAATSSVSGTLAGSGALTGSAAAASTASGTLTDAPTIGPLTGTAAATSAVSGTLAGTGAVTGTAAAASTAAGTLSGAGALTGSAAAASTASATLRGDGALSGSAAADATVSGTLAGIGDLAGTVQGDSGATGTLTDESGGSIGALTGQVDAEASVTGALTNATPVADEPTPARGGGIDPQTFARLQKRMRDAQRAEDKRREDREEIKARLRAEIEAAYAAVMGEVADEPPAEAAPIVAQAREAREAVAVPAVPIETLREAVATLHALIAQMAEDDDEEVLLLAA